MIELPGKFPAVIGNQMKPRTRLQPENCGKKPVPPRQESNLFASIHFTISECSILQKYSNWMQYRHHPKSKKSHILINCQRTWLIRRSNRHYLRKYGIGYKEIRDYKKSCSIWTALFACKRGEGSHVKLTFQLWCQQRSKSGPQQQIPMDYGQFAYDTPFW